MKFFQLKPCLEQSYNDFSFSDELFTQIIRLSKLVYVINSLKKLLYL